MPSTAIPDKLRADRARAGKLGARKRWGDPGIIRLEELTPEQRRLVMALVAAARAEQAGSS